QRRQGLAKASSLCHIPRSPRPARPTALRRAGRGDVPGRAGTRTSDRIHRGAAMSWQVGLYVAAVLIPLVAFVIEAVFIRFLGKFNAYIATAAIGLSFVLSLVGFVDYFFIEAQGVFAGHHAKAVPEPEQML